MSLSLRIAIVVSPVLVWGLLYIASRVGNVPLIRFAPWLKFGFAFLLGVSLVLFVFDRTHLSDAVAIHAWGLFGANLWVNRHQNTEGKQAITSLNSRHSRKVIST